MRRTAVVLAAIAASLIAACTERDATSPRAPGAANFSNNPGPATTCDFTAINKAAKVYYTSGSDPVFALISSMKGAGSTAAQTPYGWSILRNVAAERLSSATGAASDGALFVSDVMRCMSLSFPPGGSPDIQQGFLDNLSLILSSGIFSVRGGTGDPITPVAAFDGSPRVLAQPRWGVEPHNSWPAGPVLIWGYPTLNNNVVISAATNINTNAAGTYNGFELGTIPNGTSKNNMLVGVCYADATGGTTANLLIHNFNQILPNSSPHDLCTLGASSLSSLDAPSWFGRALARASSLILPASAHAMMQDGLFIGGLPSSWSPFNSGALLGTNTGLTFTAEPKNTRAGQNIHVVVQAMYNGVPVPNINVTIAVDNNQGQPAGAIITSGATTVTTLGDGTATFDITIGKAGGYLLVASGSVGATGVTTASAISTQFNLKNF